MRISLPAVRLAAAVVAGGLWFATGAQATWTTGLYDGFRGTFHLKNSNTTGGPDVSFTFGPRNDPNLPTSWLPIAGDWDRDLNDSVGLYNPNNGTFHLRNAITTGPAGAVFRFGPKPPNNPGWLPLAGDWDGDGTDTVGLFNPHLGRWFLRNRHTSGPPDISFVFGPDLPGWTSGRDWLPVVGDWNGDGTDSVGLYDQVDGLVYLINNNANGAKLAAGGPFRFGPPNMNLMPVAGNWNGEHDSPDQREKIGLFFLDRGGFNLNLDHQPGPAEISFNFTGARPRMLPISGNWDGAPNPVDERNPANDGAGGFLWKPVADSGSNLVVLLNSAEFGSPHKVDDCTAAGIAAVEVHTDSPPNQSTFVERGCFFYNSNPNRPTYRFSRPGAEFPPNVWLMVFRTNGDIIGFFIPDPSQRVD